MIWKIALCKTYKSNISVSLHEVGGDEFKDPNWSPQNMESKLLKRFEDKVCIIKGSTRLEIIIFGKTFSIYDAFHKKISAKKSQDVQLRDAAFVLHELFLSSKSKRIQKTR